MKLFSHLFGKDGVIVKFRVDNDCCELFYPLPIASSIATREAFHYARGVFEELKGGRCNFIFIKEDSSSWIIIKFRIS